MDILGKHYCALPVMVINKNYFISEHRKSL